MFNCESSNLFNYLLLMWVANIAFERNSHFRFDSKLILDSYFTILKHCSLNFKELHAADSRRVAETYYNLGVALGHNVKFDEAVVALEDAIKVLKLRYVYIH